MFKYCLKIFACVVLGLFVGFHAMYSLEDSNIYLQEILNRAKNSGLQPLPEDNKILSLQKAMFANSNFSFTNEQIELGKILYFDPRLSGDKKHSCNSCHNLSLGGTSPVEASELNSHKLNAPTLYNVMFNEVAYYRGNIRSRDQADKNKTNFLSKNISARAVLNSLSAKNEMNAKIDFVIENISNSEEYMVYFKRAYGSKVEISKELIAQSIAGFIMTLNTFSRYDDFLAGNLKAISINEAQGLEVFMDRGCVACHTGINLGGTMQPFEVMKDYKFANIGGLTSDSNKMLKVPTLRNITLTAPYFHNGAFTKLEDSIKEMGKMQIGISLSSKDIKKIMVFFDSLKGNLDGIELPILPKMDM